MLPNVGNSGVGIGQVKNSAQIAYAQGTKMPQLQHCETIGTQSSGATTDLQGLPHLVRSERHGAVIEFVLVSDLADDGSGFWVVSVGRGPGELLYKFCCNSPFVGQTFASEGDGLIWSRVGALPNEAPKKSPKPHGPPLDRT